VIIEVSAKGNEGQLESEEVKQADRNEETRQLVAGRQTGEWSVVGLEGDKLVCASPVVLSWARIAR
jgi:hypothetical protein